MTGGVSVASARSTEGAAAQSPRRSGVLHVCTSCRPADAPREPRDARAGARLYRELRAEVAKSPLRPYLEVKPAECLSICPRPCGVALSSVGAWSYLFGGQAPDESTTRIMECAWLYLRANEGFISRTQRPEGLRSNLLGRIPPLEGRR